MKKILITLVALFVIGGSIYTVYNYNKSNDNYPSSINTKENTSSNQNGDPSNSNSSSEQNSTNTDLNNSNATEVIKVKAMDFKLKDLNGKEVSLSDFKGKKIFLNFWASWCPPCKAEMPEMERLYEETKDSDLVILAVNLGDDKSTVQEFITNNKYNFKVLLDTDTNVASKYGIVSIPTSYFIDKDGKIINKHIGSMTIEDMKNYINDLK